MDKKLNNKNYIAIADWMISDFDFNTRELLCFAIIYGFSQDGESVFSGSLNYLSQWLGIRRDNVLRYLNSLVEKGVVTKEKKISATKSWCEYKVQVDKGAARNSDHIIISPWMIENLGLQDKELLLYSLIYGFSRVGSNSYFSGNNTYMAKWLKIDKQHVTRYSASLIKKGLIEKIEENNNIKYRVIDTNSINNDPNQFEYTLTNSEGICSNQAELEANHFEYTSNQDEYRVNHFEEEGITNLSTNNLDLNNLNNNLDNISNNNNVVDLINQELLSCVDLSKDEKFLLSKKIESDNFVLEKYNNTGLDAARIMSFYASDYLRFQTIYYFEEGRSYLEYSSNNPVSKAQDLLLNTLSLKRYKRYLDNINSLESGEIYSLFIEAYHLYNPDSFDDRHIYKTPEAYFIGVVDNVLNI